MNWGVYCTSRIDGPTKRSTACDYSEKKTDEDDAEDEDEPLIIGIEKYGGNINLCLLAPTSTSVIIIIIWYGIEFNSNPSLNEILVILSLSYFFVHHLQCPHIRSNAHQVHDDVRKVAAVYEPLGLRIDMHITAVKISELHKKAFEFYRQRLFAQAADSFAQALRLCEQNPSLEISGQPAAVLQKRCLEFAARPPPPEWNLLSPEQIYYLV